MGGGVTAVLSFLFVYNKASNGWEKEEKKNLERKNVENENIERRNHTNTES